MPSAIRPDRFANEARGGSPALICLASVRSPSIPESPTAGTSFRNESRHQPSWFTEPRNTLEEPHPARPPVRGHALVHSRSGFLNAPPPRGNASSCLPLVNHHGLKTLWNPLPHFPRPGVWRDPANRADSLRPDQGLHIIPSVSAKPSARFHISATA